MCWFTGKTIRHVLPRNKARVGYKIVSRSGGPLFIRSNGIRYRKGRTYTAKRYIWMFTGLFGMSSVAPCKLRVREPNGEYDGFHVFKYRRHAKEHKDSGQKIRKARVYGRVIEYTGELPGYRAEFMDVEGVVG